MEPQTTPPVHEPLVGNYGPGGDEHMHPDDIAANARYMLAQQRYQEYLANPEGGLIVPLDLL